MKYHVAVDGVPQESVESDAEFPEVIEGKIFVFTETRHHFVMVVAENEFGKSPAARWDFKFRWDYWQWLKFKRWLRSKFK